MKKYRKTDIAIVGMSCKFHETTNARQFWKSLKEGKELLKFYSDEELLTMGLKPEVLENDNFIKMDAEMYQSDTFDYSFFGYTREEANLMDPQIRVLHEQVWSALEDASCNPFKFDKKIGLYLSAADNFNWVAHALMNQNEVVNPFFSSQISNRSFVSTLISYSLDLKGPSLHLSTACSSSLTAVHLACRAIITRECSMAVAGGINLDTNDTKGYFYKEGMISSKDGHCRAFDKNSSGTVGGNGGGVIVLKRLEEAVKDKDHIYAVIKSSATNNDGRQKVGYTAPSVSGQSDCIKLAHRLADVPYNSISYIETHGTGTKLGDPIEIQALNKAFNNDVDHKCAIGSVKTNIGHLDAAAGIAGLIKTGLALKNKMIPPSLHFQDPNPEIQFGKGPFYVNSELTDWKKTEDSPRRAGVSSFGIGGTNAHVIVEEAPEFEGKPSTRPYQLIPFSAKTKTSLEGYRHQLWAFIQEEDYDFSDLSYTLTKKNVFKHRDFIVAKNGIEAERKLQKDSTGAVDGFNAKHVVFMFPGQGSQYFGMAKELYNQEPYYKSLIDKGLNWLKEHVDLDYSEVLGYHHENTDLEQINDTSYLQPILFLIEYSFARLLMKFGVRPTSMIGHSLGEYVAACIAEVFSFEDALYMLAKRGQLMGNVEKGSMLAIGVDVDQVAPYIVEGISIAAINTDTSCVVSGNDHVITQFKELMDSKEIPSSILKTSHAFHSKMMDPILESYISLLEGVEFSAPKSPFVSNVTGKEITNEEATSPTYWAEHLRGTVEFSKGINELLKNKQSVFLEIGPGKTLSSFCRQNSLNNDDIKIIQCIAHAKENLDDNFMLVETLGKLWSYGVDIDWEAYFYSEERNKISVPTYCFDKNALDFKVRPFENIHENAWKNNETSILESLYFSNWKKSFISKNTGESTAQTYLVFSRENSLVKNLKTELIQRENQVVEVFMGFENTILSDTQYQLDINDSDNFERLFDWLREKEIEIDQIIYNWDSVFKGQKSLISSSLTLKNLCAKIIDHDSDTVKKITFLNDFNQNVFGNENVSFVGETNKVLLSVLAQENPNIFSFSIDVDLNGNSPEMISNVMEELEFNNSDFNVAYRNGKRWVNFFDRFTLENKKSESVLSDGKVYLITGGLGFLGEIIARHMITTYNVKVVLLGRSEMPSDEEWKYILDEETNDSRYVKAKRLKGLRSLSEDVYYYQTNISNIEELGDAIVEIEKKHGNINGIVHAAGNIDKNTFKSLENLKKEHFKQQFDPKVEGTRNLYALFKERDLDFVWAVSSLSSALGGMTFGAYASANKYMDLFFADIDLEGWTSINLDGLGDQGINEKELLLLLEKTIGKNVQNPLIVSLREPNLSLIKSYESIEESEEVVAHYVERPEISMNYVPPNSRTEKELCELFKSFFGYENIGINDNFFELGGDSLKAMGLIKKIHKQFEVEINLTDFFIKPTIADIANEIDLAAALRSIQNQNKGKNVIKI